MRLIIKAYYVAFCAPNQNFKLIKLIISFFYFLINALMHCEFYSPILGSEMTESFYLAS